MHIGINKYKLSQNINISLGEMTAIFCFFNCSFWFFLHWEYITCGCGFFKFKKYDTAGSAWRGEGRHFPGKGGQWRPSQKHPAPQHSPECTFAAPLWLWEDLAHGAPRPEGTWTELQGDLGSVPLSLLTSSWRGFVPLMNTGLLQQQVLGRAWEHYLFRMLTR